MKSLIVSLLLFVYPQVASAAVDGWRMNPYTGKPDYFQTGFDSSTLTAIAASTTSLAAQTAALSVSTAANAARITSLESSTSTLEGRVDTLEVSTATLDSTLSAEILVRQALSTQVAIDTSTLESTKVSEPSSEGSSGQFLMTDGSGGRTWASALGSLLDTFNIWQSTNIFNSILMSTGTHGAGDSLIASGAGTRFFFYPKKSAIRAGQVGGTVFNDASIGEHSAGFGYDCLASGQYTSCFGGSNSATYNGASALGGTGNQSTAQSSISAGGDGNSATGSRSGVFGGGGSTASGGNSGVMSGSANVASGDYSVGLGGNNLTISGVAGGAGGQWVQNAGDYSFVWGNYVGLSASADGSMLFGYDTTSVKTYTESGKFYIHGLDLIVSSSTTAAVKFGMTKTGVATTSEINTSSATVSTSLTVSGYADLGWVRVSSQCYVGDLTCQANCPSGKKAISCSYYWYSGTKQAPISFYNQHDYCWTGMESATTRWAVMAECIRIKE